LKNTKYTLVSVTVENDMPHLQYGSDRIGKGAAVQRNLDSLGIDFKREFVFL
jgi:hypothetical protein